jgi:hypothetical protein
MNKWSQKAQDSVLEFATNTGQQMIQVSSNNNSQVNNVSRIFYCSQNHPIRLKIRNPGSVALKDNPICPPNLQDPTVTTNHDVPYQRIVLKIANRLSPSADLPNTQLDQNKDVEADSSRIHTLTASIAGLGINDRLSSALVASNVGQNINNPESSGLISSLNQTMSEEKTISDQPTDSQRCIPLPRVNQREKDCWYIYNNDLVFWDGKQLKCKHKKRRTYCAECVGGSICIHGRIKSSASPPSLHSPVLKSPTQQEQRNRKVHLAVVAESLDGRERCWGGKSLPSLRYHDGKWGRISFPSPSHRPRRRGRTCGCCIRCNVWSSCRPV